MHANLKNALNAVCGLFVMVLYLYKEQAQAGDLRPPLTLIIAGDAHYNGTTHSGHDFGFNYVL